LPKRLKTKPPNFCLNKNNIRYNRNSVPVIWNI
jgi:hypothetical protein